MNIGEKLFDMWMDKHYPYFYITTGIITLISYILIAASIISVFWAGDWWRYLLISLLITVTIKFVVHIALKSYFIPQWLNNK